MANYLERKITQTADGSQTLFIPALNEHYHSKHGALQESRHVFIQQGLELLLGQEKATIFEVGFGTGLNALLALEWAQANNIKLHYQSVEKYPLSEAEYAHLAYPGINMPTSDMLYQMHEAEWDTAVELTPFFTLEKRKGSLHELELTQALDGVFFDAFAPEKQPDLWTSDVFRRFEKKLKPNGFLVTYCAKGQVRRNMQEAGLLVERLQGPPGKREMLRARKEEEKEEA